MKTWLLLIILTSCTQQQKNRFGTIDPNPLVESRRTNKIKYYERYFINADTVVKTGTYKLDDNGRTIEIKNLSTGQQTTYIEYDSSGQQKKYMVDDQIYFTKTITYESFPDQKLLIVKAYDEGRHDTLVDYVKYNNDLKYVLRKTMINFTSKDTIHDLTYEYKKNKLVKVKDLLNMIEYHYDQADKLKEVKELNGWGISIDYISPSTGLVDSTVSDDEGQKVVTYYKYHQ